MAQAAAPGRITGKTRIMFILGDPVAHIVGTALFNEHFREIGLDAAASPIHIAAADLALFLDALPKMRNVAGTGVTIPHKIAVVPHLDRLTPRARRIGAVNFVRCEANGTLVGDNLDGIGFVAGLARNGIAVAGKRVLQAGAGGVGRAIAFAVAEAGAAHQVIANRTPDKARALAEEVGMAFPACRCAPGPARSKGFDIVVNATSLGMHAGDRLPIDTTGLAPPCTVAEVVMTPEIIPLLAEGRSRKCTIIGGKEMLLEQLQLAVEFLFVKRTIGAAEPS